MLKVPLDPWGREWPENNEYNYKNRGSFALPVFVIVRTPSHFIHYGTNQVLATLHQGRSFPQGLLKLHLAAW